MSAAVQAAVSWHGGKCARSAARHFTLVDGVDEFGRNENQEFDFVDLIRSSAKWHAEDGHI